MTNFISGPFISELLADNAGGQDVDVEGDRNISKADEFIDSNAPNGRAFTPDADGTLIKTNPTPGTPDIACFAEDTIILTNNGEIPVTDLQPGDRIPTYDSGAQTLLGLCKIHVTVGDLLRTPELRPVRLDPHLCPGAESILLSPAHCVLHRSAKAEAYFADPEVFLQARHFEKAGLAQTEIPRMGVSYYQLLFQDHALVLANGVWSESYFNSSGNKDSDHMSQDWRFVENVTLGNTPHAKSARQILRWDEALLLLRDLKAKKPERAPLAPVKMRRRLQG